MGNAANRRYEDLLIRKVLTALFLADFSLSITDNEGDFECRNIATPGAQSEDEVKPLADRLLAACRVYADEAWIIAKKDDIRGWVRLIFGNGEDVISDYTVNLGPQIDPIIDWIISDEEGLESHA